MKMLCFHCGRVARSQAKAEGYKRVEYMAIGREKAMKEVASVTQFERLVRNSKKDGTEVKRIVTFVKGVCPDCGNKLVQIVSNKPAN